MTVPPQTFSTVELSLDGVPTSEGVNLPPGLTLRQRPLSFCADFRRPLAQFAQSQQTTLKATLAARASDVLSTRKISFTIHHHSSSSHVLLQVADYCAWAIYRKWQNQDARSYVHIQGRIRNEYDIFQNGDMDYY